ncbi:phosphatidylglycerophosphatase A [Aestuariirhabdus sp. Z084]|uniref:phosphatidylglycerophosphatase A family protein n=1 Tax=Aestuariirhabdus haliotis TaxID=2918751 RepID=UPI00201B3C77|nr:phosphatidylglycerophosphatase A [Aestuariirhabdus haliotis]MCL6415058.1 phosphatidylglycerophosphatase A [Aestuariirhabdus haliotis]MCL6418990.1 phosphatidylglycerophosphatase A [Aestuariirhabdus haliotis]
MADTPASVWRNPIHFVAFGFGSGASPKAPGTVGTLAAIPFYLLLQYLPLANYLLVVLVAFVVGCWLCEITSRDIGVHDHGGIVWDEFVGFWITMIAAPPGWLWIVIGFGLFRFFDILKPWPIRWLDKKVGGGFGIMIDDVLAGLFALVVMQLLHLWLV